MKCPNCGFEIQDDLPLCPKCGSDLDESISVKDTAENDIDESKNEEGGIDLLGEDSVGSQNSSPEPPKVKFYQKSWFIVLALIFFWPLGVFLMWKYSKWNKIVKIIISILCVLSLIGLFNGGDDTTSTDEPSSVVYFEENDATNAFMTAYNAITDSPFTDIDSSSQGVECHASSYDYYFIITAPDDGSFRVRIDQTSDVFDEGMNGMKKPFHDTVKALDETLSDEEIDTFYDSFLQEERKGAGNSLGNLSVNYTPNIEMSNGMSRGYVEIKMKQYP